MNKAKEYYYVEYNDFGYRKIFSNYDLTHNNIKISTDTDWEGYARVVIHDTDKHHSRYIPIIIEKDGSKYFDLITDTKYIEKDKGLINESSGLEFSLESKTTSRNAFKVLKSLSSYDVDAYTLAIINLKKASKEYIDSNSTEEIKQKTKTYLK